MKKLKVIKLISIVLIAAFSLAASALLILEKRSEKYSLEKLESVAEFNENANYGIYAKLDSVLVTDKFIAAESQLDSLIYLLNPIYIFKNAKINLSIKESKGDLTERTQTEYKLQMQISKKDNYYAKSVLGELFSEFLELKQQGDTTINTIIFQQKDFNKARNYHLAQAMRAEYVGYNNIFYSYDFQERKLWWDDVLISSIKCKTRVGGCIDTIKNHTFVYNPGTKRKAKEILKEKEVFDDYSRGFFLRQNFKVNATLYQYDSLGRFAKIKNKEEEIVFSYDNESYSSFVAKLIMLNKEIGKYFYHKDENSESVRLTLPHREYKFHKNTTAPKEIIELKTTNRGNSCQGTKMFSYALNGTLQEYSSNYACSSENRGKIIYESTKDTIAVKYDAQLRPSAIRYYKELIPDPKANSALFREKKYEYTYD